jgi:hypothetical protein
MPTAIIRTFSSRKRTSSGGRWPGREPALSKSKGEPLRGTWHRRFQRAGRHQAGYDGHKAIPGRYQFTLKMGDQKVTTQAEILPNPLYATVTAATYKEYDTVMTRMEATVTEMHKTVNSLHEKQAQLESLLTYLPAGDKYAGVKQDIEGIIKKLKAWDEDMVQRKSKAYDDVENFANKFTANYLFVINQTESDLPRVNQGSIDEDEKLNTQWRSLKSRSDELVTKDFPSLNKKLWDLGIGAIWK